MRRAIECVCRQVKPVSRQWLVRARTRQRALTKPLESLGRLEEMGNRIAAITETTRPVLSSKRIYVVAADHGVVTEGVSAYPREVTRQMVWNFLRGGAAINVLARHGDIDVRIVDAGVDYDFPPEPRLHRLKIVRGTANLAQGPALTDEQAMQSVMAGIELARAAKREGVALIGIGEMGIGNTTAASAITAALTGCDASEVTGCGTGLDASGLARKIAVVARALAVNRPKRRDPLDILAKVGGAEIGVMMGIVLGAAAERQPVVADGFISTAAAALAVALCPAVRDYLFIGHLSKEPGHVVLVNYIGLEPLLNLDMRLGEGTGAALAMHLIVAGAKLISEMATFEEAGVSNKNQ